LDPKKPEQISEIVRGSQGQLREKEAAEIKWLARESYRARDIAEEYGVGTGAIGPIKHGENFGDVEPQKPDPIPEGLGKGWTKMSKEKAAKVKWLGQQGYNHSEIGKEYGVSQNTVSRIARGEQWKGVEPEKPSLIPEHLSPSRKLLKHEASEIKYLGRESDKTQKEIGKMYGVNSSVVSRIKRGKSWPDIQPKRITI
jgi:transcriptional regulator with XRE-family HTH domain